MRDRKRIREIKDAVRNRRLREPFRARDVQEACPGWASRTYSTFLPKHAKGNPGGNTEHFARVAPGLYELLDSTREVEEETKEIVKNKKLLRQIKEAERDWNKGAYKKGDYLEWNVVKERV